jgi:hypothetical protein
VIYQPLAFNARGFSFKNVSWLSGTRPYLLKINSNSLYYGPPLTAVHYVKLKKIPIEDLF